MNEAESKFQIPNSKFDLVYDFTLGLMFTVFNVFKCDVGCVEVGALSESETVSDLIFSLLLYSLPIYKRDHFVIIIINAQFGNLHWNKQYG